MTAGRSARAATILSLLAGGVFSIAAQPATTLPRPPGVQITRLPREPDDMPMETSVAVDPRDRRHVIVSYQQWLPLPDSEAATGATRVDARVAWSGDGGDTWTVAAGTAAPNYQVSGDPSVTFDLHGHAFLAYIGFDRTGQLWYWGKGATRNGIFVRRSLDGGRTWEAHHTPLLEYPTMTDPPFQDKGYLVADNNGTSPHAGNLYVGWTRYSLDRSEILFSRSTDDGKSWSPPIVISTEPGVPRGSAMGSVVGFHATVGRDGTIYAIWPDGHEIVLAVSKDGGRTFEPSRPIIATTLWALFSTIADFPGANGLPSIAIDSRTAPGTLYVAWGDYRNGDLDILSATSDDGGRTWTAPIRVNDDPKHDGKDQIRSWIGVDPTDGTAYVLFYDRRGDTANVRPTVTLARSTDHGRTFVNYAWSTVPSDPKQALYGDYSGLAVLGGRVYGAWTENAPKPGPAASDPSASRGDPRLRNVIGNAGGPSAIHIGIADFKSKPN